MKVRILIALLGLFFVFLLSGCEGFVNNPPLSDYEAWRISDEAEDLNGDRKIDELDYELFLNPVVSEYDLWRNSDEAIDMNGDRKINEEDYELFLLIGEFVGSYHIENYQYVGNSTVIFETELKLETMDSVLEGITIDVDEEGVISANIPAETITALGGQFAVVLEAFSNMSITRVSKFIIALDTTVVIEEVEINVTLYLTEIDNGYRTSYIINYNDLNSVISFDIIRDEA